MRRSSIGPGASPALGRGADPLRAHELADGPARLRAAGEPVPDALLVEDDLRRLGLGVVAPDGLDHAAVAGRALVGDYDAPNRVLLASHAGQPHSYGQVSDHLSKAKSWRGASRRAPVRRQR